MDSKLLKSPRTPCIVLDVTSQRVDIRESYDLCKAIRSEEKMGVHLKVISDFVDFLRFRYTCSLRHVNHQKEYILLTQKNGVRLLKESHTFIVTTPRDPFIVPSLYSRVSYPYCYCLYHGMSQFQRNQ